MPRCLPVDASWFALRSLLLRPLRGRSVDIRLSRLVEDLAGSFRGELLVDPVALTAYASDASLFAVCPLAVACPRDVDDVATLVRYAAEHQLPLIPRGSGTGTAGGAIGAGIVLDLSRHLRRIGEVEHNSIRVEAGVALAELQRRLSSQKLWLPADPDHAATTTIGSLLAVDAAGSRSLAIGTIRRHVASIELVLADGRCVVAASQLRTDSARNSNDIPPEIASPVLRMLDDRRDVLDRQRRILRHRGGGSYALHQLIDPHAVHWPQLFIGSEGTLGIFTAATLRLAPLPTHRGAVVLSFSSLESAVRAAPRLAAASIAACDLLDRRLLSLAREPSSPWAELFSTRAEAALLVEWFADSDAARHAGLNRVLSAAAAAGTDVEICRIALNDADVAAVWSLPASIQSMLARLPGLSRPLSLIDDVAVPPDRLEEAIVRIQKALQQRGLTASLYAHAAAGELHFRPHAVPPSPDQANGWADLADEVAAIAAELGGCVGGEHGSGLARSSVQRHHDREYASLCHAVKELFDPRGLLNPGKLFTEPGPLDTAAFRPGPTNAPTLTELQLRWSPAALAETAARCHGCGSCRTTAPDLRMCPFFRDDPDELASPRAKANVGLRMARDPWNADVWITPSGQRVLETCFNCKQCVRECPAEVDIPAIVLEARAQSVATHGLSRGQWYLTRGPHWMPWLRNLARLLNPLLGQPWFRRMIETVFGITQHRRFPSIASKPFLHSAPREWLAPPAKLDSETVIYFVDHYANWHDPELALIAGRVLEHQGLRVHVPPGQVGSGMDLISIGDLDAARPLAEQNALVLAEFARAGCPIVCTEPSAALCLRVEYPRLIDHPDLAAIAARTDEIGRFLGRLHAQRRLRTEFRPVSLAAAYHQPCHLRALGDEASLQELCGLIPAVSSPRIEAGCSGMAGTFGWVAETYPQSVSIGATLAAAWKSSPAAVALSECSNCRLQLEHLTRRPARHPLKVLAEAYGLCPPR